MFIKIHNRQSNVVKPGFVNSGIISATKGSGANVPVTQEFIESMMEQNQTLLEQNYALIEQVDFFV